MRHLLKILLYLVWSPFDQAAFGQITIDYSGRLQFSPIRIPEGLARVTQYKDSVVSNVNEFDRNGNVIFVKNRNLFYSFGGHYDQTSVVCQLYLNEKIIKKYFIKLFNSSAMQIVVIRYEYDTLKNRIKEYRLIKKIKFKNRSSYFKIRTKLNDIDSFEQFFRSDIVKAILNKHVKSLFSVSYFDSNNRKVAEMWHKPLGKEKNKADSFFYNKNGELVTHKVALVKAGYEVNRYEYINGLKVKEFVSSRMLDYYNEGAFLYTNKGQLNCMFWTSDSIDVSRYCRFVKDTFSYNEAGFMTKRTSFEVTLDIKDSKETKRSFKEEDIYTYDSLGYVTEKINYLAYFNRKSREQYVYAYVFY